MRGRAPAAAIGALSAGLAAANAPPIPEYPQIDETRARHALAVVEVLEEDYLPPFPECASADVICMDPPPTWFRGRVLAPVHGDVPAAEFIAATTSHMGPGLGPDEGAAPVPRLMVLLTDGRGMVMPRYADAELERDSSGAFHLPVWDDYTIWWLPCGVTEVITPVTDDSLARAASVAREDYWPGRDGLDATLVREQDGRVMPRHSIPIHRLREWLARAEDVPPDLRCRTGDED